MSPSPELGARLVRDEQRLLDDVRRIQPTAKPGIDLKPGQQAEIIGVLLQRAWGSVNIARRQYNDSS